MSSFFCCFEISTKIKLSSCFIFGHKIGKSSQGTVLLAKKVNGKDAGTLYCVKVMERRRFINKCYTKESDLLTNITNPFIIKWHYGFQTDFHYFTVYDYHCGDDLHNIIRRMKLSEENVKFYLAELIVALNYLHSLEIIHG